MNALYIIIAKLSEPAERERNMFWNESVSTQNLAPLDGFLGEF